MHANFCCVIGAIYLSSLMNISHPKKGKVFYRYLLSYIPIFLIPLILSVALLNKSQNILNDEAERANELLLGQMTSYIDLIMSDVNQLNSLVSRSQRLEGMLYETTLSANEHNYRSLLLAKDFDTYNRANESVLDFYIYLPWLDKVISSYGTHSSMSFHSNWMSKLNITYEDWIQNFSTISEIQFQADKNGNTMGYCSGHYYRNLSTA